MPKVWSITNLQRSTQGFSPVEVLLAVTVFGVLTFGLIGAIVYGRQSTSEAGERSRAIMLAEEGTEALRNIRDAAYTNLVDGTYGLVQSANQWTMSGSSDSTGIFTRTISVAAAGTDRKSITSTVSWPRPGGTSSVSIETRLTNWAAAMATSWQTPVQSGGLDLTSTNAAIKVATQGDYAYIVRNDGTPDFVIVNIATPSSPTVAGTLSLSGAPTNIFVSGNYAYVTTTDDAAELRIINISNPASPTLTSAYNAPGAANGQGIYVVDGYAHLVRAANGGSNEYLRLNVSNPATPTLSGSYGSNVSMYEVYVSGSNIYIASSSDTLEVIELTVFLGSVISAGGVNLPGTTNATTITGSGTTLAVGQGTSMHTVEGGLINSIYGSLTLPGTINDLAYSPGLNLLFAGTSYATGELQIINPANVSALAFYSAVNMTGSAILSGVAYSDTKDRVIGASNVTTQEAAIFAPN